MRLPFTSRQLAKVATVGAVFIAGNVTVMHYLVQKRFHQSEYFVKAAEAMLSHKPLVEYIGEPIKFGNPNLSDTEKNYSTTTKAQFHVPVVGSKTQGVMTLSAVKNENVTLDLDNSEKTKAAYWMITHVEVILDDRPNEKVVIVKKESS